MMNRVMKLTALALMTMMSLTGLTAQAHAQSKAAIAVITLDETTSADALVINVKSSLERKEYQVVSETELRELMRKRQAEDRSDLLRERFVGISAKLTEGINSYFYDGPKPAIKALGPLVGLGLQNLNYLTANPAVAPPIYEGAATLLRAYFDAQDGPNAKALAAVLAKSFPSQLPSTKTISPEVLQLVLSARQELETQKTYIAIQGVELDKGCKVFLNGMEVVPSTYIADASTTYFVRVDCGDGQEPVIWQFKPEPGQTNRLPVISKDPFSYKIKDATFESRDQIEQVIRFVAKWSGVKTIVGVSKKAAGSTGDGVLMVRVEEGKSAIWSDGADQVALQRVLPRILPELSGESLDFGSNVSSSASSSSGNAGVWAWTSLGVGVAAMGAGGYLFYSADAEAQRLRCSNPNATSAPSGCAGIERYDGLTNDEFDDRSGSVTNQRILAGSALGVGAILTGLGIWLLLDDDDEPTKASTTLFIAPSPDGFGAGIRAEF